ASLARVGTYATRPHTGGREGVEQLQGALAAHICSCGGRRPARCKGTSGASGATPRARSAPSVTRANTGAATAPPKCAPALGSSIITATTMRGSDAGAKPTKDETYLSV